MDAADKRQQPALYTFETADIPAGEYEVFVGKKP